MIIKRSNAFSWPDIVVACLFFIAAWFIGYRALSDIYTDPWSESQAVNDAKKIYEGQHENGIVGYTHFPNGPSYVLIPFVAAGVSDASLRLVPLTFSAFAFAVFILAMLMGSSSALLKGWTIIFGAAFLCQPAFAGWQGALHEFSFAFALCLLMIVLASGENSPPSWQLMTIGFVSGWIGYDFLPPQFFALMTVRFFIYGRQTSLGLPRALLLAFRDGLFFLCGTLYAVLTHLVQIALFFNSLSTALHDLLGSASLRMGLESQELFNATYGGTATTIGTYNPFIITFRMLQSFLFGTQSPLGSGVVYDGPHRWATPGIVVPVFWAGMAIIVYASYLKIHAHKSTLRRQAKYLLTIAVGLAGSCASWYFLMSHHAAGHFLYLPRHFLVGLSCIGMLSIVAFRKTRMIGANLFESDRQILSQILFCAVPFFLLGISFVFYSIN